MRSATKDNPNSHEQAISFTVKNDTPFLWNSLMASCDVIL
jgi:hypothetical protein